MAFPTIPTVASGDLLSSTTSPASTTHTFPNLSSLRGGAGPQAGDLLIAICVQYQGGTANAEFSSWGASFTEFLDDALGSGTGNGADGFAYKVATGSESGTFTVTSAHSFKSTQFLLRIPAGTWHGTTAPATTGSARAAGAAGDPGALSPSWGADDTLWIAVAGQTETSTTGSPPVISGAPTNYSGDLIVARVADAVGDITAGVAFRQVNAASEDVGVWTGSNFNRGNGIAALIAVRPAVVVTETPGIGAAVGDGLGPTVAAKDGSTAAQIIGGGVGGAPVPTAKAGHVIAGALGDGIAASARAAITIDGAVAGGFSPTVPVFETPGIGGAVADGVSPAASSSSSISGALAGGFAPTEQLSETSGIGGALAGGVGGAADVDHAAGGGAGQGSSPEPAVVPITIAGALAGGFEPSESTSSSDTTTIGGALADGRDAGALVELSAGGALAGGFAPGEQISESTAIGGATAGGFDPGASSSVVTGGGSGQGIDVDGARIALTIAGAIAGGFSPTIPGSDNVSPGGAIAGGFDPGGVRVPGELGGAIAEGLDAGVFVLVEPGGAVADGITILIPQGVYGPPVTGEILRPDGGAIIVGDDEKTGSIVSALAGSVRTARAGRIEEPTTGRTVQ